jgi:hypothetical protein
VNPAATAAAGGWSGKLLDGHAELSGQVLADLAGVVGGLPLDDLGGGAGKSKEAESEVGTTGQAHKYSRRRLTIDLYICLIILNIKNNYHYHYCC